MLSKIGGTDFIINVDPATMASSIALICQQETTSMAPEEAKCAVCSDRVYSNRYGVPACLGCIVFFRRSVVREAKYRCARGQKCVIDCKSRCTCRCCRFQKCFDVGMAPEAIQRRDVMGPRKKKVLEEYNPKPDSPTTSECNDQSDSEDTLESLRLPPTTGILGNLYRLQEIQRATHRFAFSTNTDVKPNTRHEQLFADLRLAVLDAVQWANQFPQFQKMEFGAKVRMLAEYACAFLLAENRTSTAESVASTSSTTILRAVECSDLVIDDTECAFLKALLMLYHKDMAATTTDPSVLDKKEELIEQAMHYCRLKCGDEGLAIERLGALLLKTSAIRCGIPRIVDATSEPEFNLDAFNQLVQDVLKVHSI